MSIDKRVASAAEAVAGIPDGAVLGIGGFGPSRTYLGLIPALLEQGTKDLRAVANSVGGNPNSLWTLVENHRVAHLIVSISRGVDEFLRSGEVSLELVPQGTLVERLRAGGSGVAAFYVRTGYGTRVAEGKDVRWFDGRPHLLEHALKVDYAFIRAHRADRYGNLSFRGVGSNLNLAMAKAARVVVVEAAEVVEALDPDEVDLPGALVTRVLQQAPEVMPFPKTRRGGVDIDTAVTYAGKPGWTRRQMAEVAAGLLPEPAYVNLGLGIPTLVANFTGGRDIVTHAENGMLGIGSDATPEDYDQNVYNAGSYFVHPAPGASYFDSVTSFEMVRGGRIDVVVLGGLQVDAAGNLANWATSDRYGGTIGGAMDLAASGAEVMVMMTHLSTTGEQKLVQWCRYPLTGTDCVDTVVTDLCVLRRTEGAFHLVRVADGFSADEIVAMTELPLVEP